MNTPTMLSTGRNALTARRKERNARRRLERELGEFRTPAERIEIDAILDRYPGEVTWELRRILAAQALSTGA